MASKIPEKLSARSKKLWGNLLTQWDLDTHHLILLEIALRALDRIDEARDEIEKHGIVTQTKTKYRRANPAVAIERDARNGFLQAWSKMGWDQEPPRDVGRPTR